MTDTGMVFREVNLGYNRMIINNRLCMHDIFMTENVLSTLFSCVCRQSHI